MSCINGKFKSFNKPSQLLNTTRTEFNGTSCIVDGMYFGEIWKIEGKIIKVQCRNANQFMSGKIYDFVMSD